VGADLCAAMATRLQFRSPSGGRLPHSDVQSPDPALKHEANENAHGLKRRGESGSEANTPAQLRKTGLSHKLETALQPPQMKSSIDIDDFTGREWQVSLGNGGYGSSHILRSPPTSYGS